MTATWPGELEEHLDDLQQYSVAHCPDCPDLAMLLPLKDPEKAHCIGGIVDLSDRDWRRLDQFASQMAGRTPENRLFTIPGKSDGTRLLATLLPTQCGSKVPLRRMSSATGDGRGWLHTVRLDFLILDEMA
ncbi:hypothetical protein [Coralliovum pocilloporae]|uniref:hypothetical protein n=1 Tax=Coralliovum pocilloporae TaxID=3066369 RepID=UPI003307340E